MQNLDTNKTQQVFFYATKTIRTSLSELLQNYQKYCQCLSDVQSELSELLAEFVKALVRIFEVFYILNQSYYCRDKICTSSSLMTQQPDKFIFTSKLIPRTQKGLTITIKLPYVIANVFQNFSVRGIRRQIPKSIYQASYLLPSDFPNHFSKACSYLNRVKDG